MPILQFWETACGICKDVAGHTKLTCIVAPASGSTYNINFWLCHDCNRVARLRGMGEMAYARDPDTHARLIKERVPQYIACPRFQGGETPLTPDGIDGLVKQAEAQGFYINREDFTLFSQRPEPSSGPLTVLREEDKRMLARKYEYKVFRHGDVSKGKEFAFFGKMRTIADVEKEGDKRRIFFTTQF